MSLLLILFAMTVIPFNTTIPYEQIPDIVNVVVVEIDGTITEEMTYITDDFNRVGNYSMIYRLPSNHTIPDAFEITYDSNEPPIVYKLAEDSKKPFTLVGIEDQPSFDSIVSSKTAVYIMVSVIIICCIVIGIHYRSRLKRDEPEEQKMS